MHSPLPIAGTTRKCRTLFLLQTPLQTPVWFADGLSNPARAHQRWGACLTFVYAGAWTWARRSFLELFGGFIKAIGVPFSKFDCLRDGPEGARLCLRCPAAPPLPRPLWRFPNSSDRMMGDFRLCISPILG